MRILLDTNILINWLVEKNTKHKEANRLIFSCFLEGVQGYVTSHSLTDAFYVLRKYHPSTKDRQKFIRFMVQHFTILTEDSNDFLAVLNAEDFFDLEDGLQIRCAQKANLDYIVTENLKDFKNSSVPTIDIDEALAII